MLGCKDYHEGYYVMTDKICRKGSDMLIFCVYEGAEKANDTSLGNKYRCTGCADVISENDYDNVIMHDVQESRLWKNQQQYPWRYR